MLLLRRRDTASRGPSNTPGGPAPTRGTAIADGWFKRVDKGEDLVQACLPHLDDGTYLGRMFARMQAWMMRP